uniref:Uncharacterized protein n=1 Tax=Leptobrachium leishanense TaxID=445787 RepID=A0A8C5MEA2_9ANUR
YLSEDRRTGSPGKRQDSWHGIGVTSMILILFSPLFRSRTGYSFPESNPAILAETRKRNELVLQKIKEAAETNENVSRKSPWSS